MGISACLEMLITFSAVSLKQSYLNKTMNICDMAEVVINAKLVFPSLLILFDSTAWGCIHAKVIQLHELEQNV